MGVAVTTTKEGVIDTESELARVRQEGKVWCWQTYGTNTWQPLAEYDASIATGLRGRLIGGLLRRRPRLVCTPYGPEQLHRSSRRYSVTLEPGHEYALGASRVLQDLDRYHGT